MPKTIQQDLPQQRPHHRPQPIQRLFAPVNPLLQRMTLGAKFALVATVLTVPLLGLLGAIVVKQNADLDYTRGELGATPLANELIDASDPVRAYRSALMLAANKVPGAEALVDGRRKQLLDDLAMIDKAVAASPKPKRSSPRWRCLANRPKQLGNSCDFVDP